MFPFIENFAFWMLTAVVCLAVYMTTRRRVRKQLVFAPQSALRSPAQRAMHWVSLLLIVIPLGYVALIDGEAFWPAFSILWAQAGSWNLLRRLGVAYVVRAWLLIPLAAVSALIGAIVAVWPAVESSSLQAAPWAFLLIAAAAFAVSSAVSLYSFPAGHGERSR